MSRAPPGRAGAATKEGVWRLPQRQRNAWDVYGRKPIGEDEIQREAERLRR